MCARRRTYLLLLRQKKVGQEKTTPLPVSPIALSGAGGSLRCSVLGCAAELAAFFELRSNSCGKLDNDARVLRHALTPGPALLGTVRRGWIPTRAIASLGPIAPRCASASAARNRHPAQLRQQQPSLAPLPTPSGCAEKRRSWGGCMCRRTHALRRLARRCCLSGVRRTQRVHRRPPQIRASQAARSEAKGRRQRGAVSLPTFFLRMYRPETW